jgi:hypothetical protein
MANCVPEKSVLIDLRILIHEEYSEMWMECPARRKYFINSLEWKNTCILQFEKMLKQELTSLVKYILPKTQITLVKKWCWLFVLRQEPIQQCCELVRWNLSTFNKELRIEMVHDHFQTGSVLCIFHLDWKQLMDLLYCYLLFSAGSDLFRLCPLWTSRNHCSSWLLINPLLISMAMSLLASAH